MVARDRANWLALTQYVLRKPRLRPRLEVLAGHADRHAPRRCETIDGLGGRTTSRIVPEHDGPAIGIRSDDVGALNPKLSDITRAVERSGPGFRSAAPADAKLVNHVGFIIPNRDILAVPLDAAGELDVLIQRYIRKRSRSLGKLRKNEGARRHPVYVEVPLVVVATVLVVGDLAIFERPPSAPCVFVDRNVAGIGRRRTNVRDGKIPGRWVDGATAWVFAGILQSR